MSSKRRAIFLDRDGVLNVNTHYVYRVEDFQWIPGAKEAIKRINDTGFLTIVVTNQSGIARGYYTEEDFKTLMDWTQSELAKIGARFDAIYNCPHHPEHGEKIDSDWRKPKPGMLLQAAKDHEIELAHSHMIGDSESDRRAAQAARVAFHHFTGGNLLEFVERCVIAGD